MEEERAWAFNLDAFLSAENRFSGGRVDLGKLLQQAMENDRELAAQVNEALESVRIRDPRNRKDPDPAHPMTPGEIFLSEASLKLLVSCAQTIQDRLMKMRGHGIETEEELNLVDELLKNVRLRASKFKKNRQEGPS